MKSLDLPLATEPRVPSPCKASSELLNTYLMYTTPGNKASTASKDHVHSYHQAGIPSVGRPAMNDHPITTV